jgi:hypothetical protein
MLRIEKILYIYYNHYWYIILLGFFFRQKAAQQEARKLAHIQREVMILDNLLTADVNVIRSRIELASRDFLDAQYVYIILGDCHDRTIVGFITTYAISAYHH